MPQTENRVACNIPPEQSRRHRRPLDIIAVQKQDLFDRMKEAYHRQFPSLKLKQPLKESLHLS